MNYTLQADFYSLSSRQHHTEARLAAHRHGAGHHSLAPSAAQIMADRDGSLPVWVRAPKYGHEFFSGCTRPKLYDWAGKEFIRSVSIRRLGKIKGVRLFHLASILSFIERIEVDDKLTEQESADSL